MHRTLLLIFSIMVNHIFLGAIGYAADTGLDAAKKEAAVVVYTGSSAADAAKLIAAFETKYPFVKVNLFRGNNERVLNKILTEGRTGSYLFDVATIDGLNGWVLKEHDYLQPHKSKETEAFPLEFQDPTGLLPCCMTVVTNMIGYNSRQVAKKDAPRTYQDLLDPKWKNSMGMDPDEAEWFRALISIWGKEKTVKYFTELERQNTSTRRGHTLLSNLLAAGEFPVAVNIFGHRILELQGEGGTRGTRSCRSRGCWPPSSSTLQKGAASECRQAVYRLHPVGGGSESAGILKQDRGSARYQTQTAEPDGRGQALSDQAGNGEGLRGSEQALLFHREINPPLRNLLGRGREVSSKLVSGLGEDIGRFP